MLPDTSPDLPPGKTAFDPEKLAADPAPQALLISRPLPLNQ
jgi:hypothetical protein